MLTRGSYWAVDKIRTGGSGLAGLLRLVVRRPRNVIMAIILAFAVALVWLMLVSVASIQAAEQRDAAAAQQATAEPLLVVTASPVEGSAQANGTDPSGNDSGATGTESPAPTESGEAEDSTLSTASSDKIDVGDGPQAVEPGDKLPPASPVDIPAPTEPSADTAKPEEVAKAWAKAYFARPDGTWDDWQEWAEPWVAPNLLDFMADDEFNERGALNGKQASRVLDVRLSAADGSTGRDTPVRWSRTVEIDVQTTDGRITTVTYIIEENLGQSGWQIVNAEKKFWTVK